MSTAASTTTDRVRVSRINSEEMTVIGRDDVGTIDDLHASATKVVGLDDFGDDGYREGLQVLLESYAKDAELTPSATR